MATNRVSEQGSVDAVDEKTDQCLIIDFRLPLGRAVLCPDGMRVELTNDKKLSCVNEFCKKDNLDCFRSRVPQTDSPNDYLIAVLGDLELKQSKNRARMEYLINVMSFIKI